MYYDSRLVMNDKNDNKNNKMKLKMIFFFINPIKL